MLQRPKIGETEEDLLQQEEEFLRQSGKVSTQGRNPEVNPGAAPSSSKVSGVVGEVVERDQSLSNAASSSSEAKGVGFPALFEIDPNISPDKKGKKSLFALQMEKNKDEKNNMSMEVDVPESSTRKTETSEESGAKSEVALNIPGSLENNDLPQDVNLETNEESGNASSISGSMRNTDLPQDVIESMHSESLAELSSMSESAILEAQKKLYETLSPELIAILKCKPKSKEEQETKNKPQPQEEASGDSLDEHERMKERLANYIGDRWVNMDFLEKEKLEWVGDIPNFKSLEPGKPYSARFNFKGELQPFTTEIDVTNALYHHGDEPERPGYTIQELYQLSRSAVLQQRILALKTLANIIQKTKLGRYDVCFDGHLLHKLLEADLFLLLRFSIDDNSLIPAAMKCLRRLLCNDSDEYCLDRLMGITKDDVQPLLYDKIELDKDEENELEDKTIIKCDLIRGALRTDLLDRISYILNNIKCDRETIANAFLCIIRIARHSVEACQEILKCTDLLNFVYSSINCPDPIYQGVRLFGLLIGHSREMADEIYVKYDMSFLVSYLDVESMSRLSRKDFYLLKLECIYLWKNFIRFEYMVEEFIYWTPCFIRIIEFYIETVDIFVESDFDFEMFTALMSLLRLCVRDTHPVDVRYQDTVAILLEKWVKQLSRFPEITYASMKALGSCFAYYVEFFDFYGVDEYSYNFIIRLNEIIMAIIPTPGFNTMATCLIEYSHILTAKLVRRDPSNLPSLCSVYNNGDGFLKIVDNESTLPFFISFVKYLKFGYFALPEAKINVKMFLRCPAIRKYITEVIKLNKHAKNWFNQFEFGFLADILQLSCLINDELCLKLGFRLLPMLRVDDENLNSVLTLITDKKNWSCDEELFNSLSDVYLEYLYKPEKKPYFALRYKNESVGEDWVYKILSLTRGKEAVAEVGKALKFTTFILNHNSQLLERIPYTLRYYHLCAVFLTDDNVFDDDIQTEMRSNFDCILCNRDKVNLNLKVDKNTSFYDLYTELITQYAAVSYGLPIFAELVVFPLQNRFNPSFRKLLWFEYHHALRVITLPYPAEEFIDVKDFVEPCETDESLLIAYVDSIMKNVILKTRNPFVYNVAVSNVKNYMRSKHRDPKLYKFLNHKINHIANETTRQDFKN